MKRFSAWLAALALLMLLPGCAQFDEPAADELPFPMQEPVEEEKQPTLPVSFSLPYLAGQPLNPLTCPDGMQQTLASLLYEGLFELDETLTPQPLLCSAWDYDADTLTYTLTLRSDVVFSDGSHLTSNDVKTTLNAARSSPRYAERLTDIKSITARGDTVVLALQRGSTALPALLDIPILKAGTEKNDVPTGTGPYLYDESSAPCLTASQNWWQRIAQPVERIPLTETADHASMIYRFASHDIQAIVTDLTGTDSATVSGNISCTDADTTVFQFLGINTTVSGLDNAAFRRCLSQGLNRQSLVSGLLSGHAKAAQFPISPVSPLYPSVLEQSDSVTLSEALADCETRPAHTLRLLVNEENPFKVSVAKQIAAAFTSGGVETEAVVLPWEEYTAALASGNFDLYYGEVRLRADWDVSELLATGGSLNYGNWSDLRCDQLLEVCRNAQDRAAALETLCRYLQNQAPILPICFKTVSLLYETDVLSGVSPTAAQPFYHLQNLSIHLREP